MKNKWHFFTYFIISLNLILNFFLLGNLEAADSSSYINMSYMQKNLQFNEEFSERESLQEVLSEFSISLVDYKKEKGITSLLVILPLSFYKNYLNPNRNSSSNLKPIQVSSEKICSDIASLLNKFKKEKFFSMRIEAYPTYSYSDFKINNIMTFRKDKKITISATCRDKMLFTHIISFVEYSDPSILPSSPEIWKYFPSSNEYFSFQGKGSRYFQIMYVLKSISRFFNKDKQIIFNQPF